MQITQKHSSTLPLVGSYLRHGACGFCSCSRRRPVQLPLSFVSVPLCSLPSLCLSSSLLPLVWLMSSFSLTHTQWRILQSGPINTHRSPVGCNSVCQDLSQRLLPSLFLLSLCHYGRCITNVAVRLQNYRTFLPYWTLFTSRSCFQVFPYWPSASFLLKM